MNQELPGWFVANKANEVFFTNLKLVWKFARIVTQTLHEVCLS